MSTAMTWPYARLSPSTADPRSPGWRSVWVLSLAVFLSLGGTAVGGEIIFVDPARERAQAQRLEPRLAREQAHERALDEARARVGREPTAPQSVLVIEGEPLPPATEQARRARDYLDETPQYSGQVILRSGQPPSEAAKARQAARSWVEPATSNASPTTRCRTENSVGGVEGAVQGHLHIQGTGQNTVTICR